jgi:methyl-accepting chemotaxis protein
MMFKHLNTLANYTRPQALAKAVPNSMAEVAAITDLTARRQEAEQDYLTGLGKLKEAELQAYRDKKALLTAYRHLATAVQKNRNEPRYQTALAYLLILIENPSRALQHIAEALRLDPSNERALLLQENLKALQQASPERKRLASWQTFQGLPQPVASEDFDDLYDDVAFFLNQEVKLMMQTMVSPQPSLDYDQMLEQEQVYEQLIALEEMVNLKLQVLDHEMDIQTFETLFKPLHQMQARFAQALEGYAMYQVLLGGFEKAQEQIETLKAALETQDPTLQAQLDSILDLCDELADQMDQLSESISIQPIESDYEQLVAQVERLQDRMDECA